MIDESIAYQHAVDRRARRSAVADFALHLVCDPAGTPPPMVPSHLADQRLDIRLDPVRTRMWASGPVGEPSRPASWYRLHHMVMVCRETPNRSATSATGAPPSTSVTARNRISTVTRDAMTESDSICSADGTYQDHPAGWIVNDVPTTEGKHVLNPYTSVYRPAREFEGARYALSHKCCLSSPQCRLFLPLP